MTIVFVLAILALAFTVSLVTAFLGVTSVWWTVGLITAIAIVFVYGLFSFSNEIPDYRKDDY
jgi:hypothetical protein